MKPGPWGRWVDSFASKLAFFPPQPPSYSVRTHNDATGELYIDPADKRYPKVLSARVSQLETANGHSIVTAFIPYRDARGPARATLLHSHGNAVDLGQMLPILKDVSQLLKVNVFSYDYAGYGGSGGTPGVYNTFADISAALQHLQEAHNVRLQDVVLYGQSVGSGPTCWLAAQPQGEGVAGVVLHSPLLSGMRVINPGLKHWPSWADIFPNHQHIKRIKAPVLVLHGTQDQVIHVSAGQRLAALAPAAVEPLWAEGYGHQDIEACPRYLPRLQAFLAQLFPQHYKPPPGSNTAGAGAAAARRAA